MPCADLARQLRKADDNSTTVIQFCMPVVSLIASCLELMNERTETDNSRFPVHYRIIPVRPQAHIFKVICTVQHPDSAGPVLWMPTWIPGSYMIRDFARNIVSISAKSAGQSVAMEKLDKTTWQCAPCQGPVEIEYEVYAWDLSVRTAHLDTTHGYFNGSSVFLAVRGYEDAECGISILPGSDDSCAGWQVATTLPSDAAVQYEFGDYRASGYLELIDHPVEMGRFTRLAFEACGVPHEVVISGRHSTDGERLCSDLQRICEHHIRFFGEPAPVERYLFLVWVVGDGYGGLEHRSSTSLLCSRRDLPGSAMSGVSDEYRGFLGLCSHEYFHTWNVKRIQPQELASADLTRETYTRQLWIFEGITSYYDDLALVRCGLIEAESYLELLARNLTRVLRGSGRFRQSVAESSFDAWTKFYRQDENAPNAIVSYYTKGALVALALDLTMRRETGGRVSLDQVMAQLWARFGRGGDAVPEGAVEALCAELSGIDPGAFFDTAVRGTQDLPWADLLGDVGVRMTLHPARSDKDQGGVLKDGDAGYSDAVPWFGARVVDSGGQPRLANVYDDGPAQKAGLSAGDILVAVDGLMVSVAQLDALVRERAAGAAIHVHAFRRDELMEFDLVLEPAPANTCYLALDDRGQGAERRTRWLAASGCAG